MISSLKLLTPQKNPLIYQTLAKNKIFCISPASLFLQKKQQKISEKMERHVVSTKFKKNQKKGTLQNFKNFATPVKNFVFCTKSTLLFDKFTNLLMIDGKKVKASQILFNTLVALEKKIKKDLDKTSESVLLLNPKLFGETSAKLESFNHFQKVHAKNEIFCKGSSFFQKNSTDKKEFSMNSQVFHVIYQALENLTPNLEVRKVRVAGSTYSVPAIVSKKKQQTLALKWIIESAKKRKKTSKQKISLCLADEILDASKKLGGARQKRDDLHRLALSNRAYVRYRWW